MARARRRTLLVHLAIVNVATAGELDRPTGPATALVGASLTAGWSLLLIPAALRMRRRFRGDGRLLGPATVAGVARRSRSGLAQPIARLGALPLSAAWSVTAGVSLIRREPAPRTVGAPGLNGGAKVRGA